MHGQALPPLSLFVSRSLICNYLFLTFFSHFSFLGPIHDTRCIVHIPKKNTTAGVIGRIVGHLGEYEHKYNKKTGHAESIFIFFEMEVDRVEEKWPEMKKRERRWVS